MKLLSIFILILSAVVISGCGNEKPKEEKGTVQQSELIRDQGTDVASLDKNQDGVVFQCPMDYQVISDSLDSCPVCKMDLEEYSVADAQNNLANHYHQ